MKLSVILKNREIWVNRLIRISEASTVHELYSNDVEKYTRVWDLRREYTARVAKLNRVVMGAMTRFKGYTTRKGLKSYQ